MKLNFFRDRPGFSSAATAAVLIPLTFAVAAVGWRATPTEQVAYAPGAGAPQSTMTATFLSAPDLSVPKASDVRFVDPSGDAMDEATTF